jgi:hypothetical protein
MSLKTTFNRQLDDLWRRRTAELRCLVHGAKPGRSVAFSRQGRDKAIAAILATATSLFLKNEGAREFRNVTNGRRLWRIKGRGLIDRGNHLSIFSQGYPKTPIVYVFWRSKRCLYVGKGNNGGRLRSYAKSAYLREASCIEVFEVRSKSLIGKAECLATHLFRPRDNKVKAARQKWGKKCPICRGHDQLRAEVRSLFKMK